MSELLDRTAERRTRLLNGLDKAAIVIPAARGAYRNGDSEYGFRQASDFYYLTAFEEPDAVCVLRPQAEERFVLFVRPKDRQAEIWSGRRTGVEGAQQQFKADSAHPIEELPKRLPELLRDVDVLYYTLGVDDALDRIVQPILAEHRRTRPRRGCGIVEVHDPSSVLHEMRLLKDDYEIDRMRAAADATVAGHMRVLQESRARMHEYQLEAMLEYEFRVRGARGPAYGTIVGCGDNATILHYRANNSRLQEGQLVLVDAGAEIDLYAADVTRTFPVSRAFTAEQKALYEVVLEAQQRAIATVRPGVAFDAPHTQAVQTICEGLVALGLLSGSPEEARESGAYREFYMHRTSHWLGLDVHDAGLYRSAGAVRELAAGMVLTVEPGIYVAADQESVPAAFRGIGIRIEDDVLVTTSGSEVLTAALPKEIAAIEALRAATVTSA